jgi:TPR repeat protein
MQFQEFQLPKHPSTLQPSALDYGAGLPNQFNFKLQSSPSFTMNNKSIQPDINNTHSKKRLPTPNSLPRNDLTKKQCLESMKLKILSQSETLESLIDKSWDGKKKEIVKEYQDLAFLKIYKEFEPHPIEDNEALKRKSQSMPGGYLKILSYHSSELINKCNPKNYTDTELFSLYMMHATYFFGAKLHKGSLAIRKHEQLVREELERRAKNNNPIALCCLGEIQKNENLLAKAYQLGNLRAKYQLARLLTNEGNSYVHDKVSLDWMSDTPGFSSFNLEIWLSLNKITNLKLNPTKISNGWILMKELEEQGNEKALFYMGKLYEHFGNIPKSNNCYVQSAKQKNEYAQERLGDPDFKEACNLYSDALDNNAPNKSYKAQRKLGEFFFNGEKGHTIKNILKIQINPFITEYWLLLNAEKSPKNYYLLGEFFDNSYEDYVKAADKGYYKAQYILGKAFSGEVVEKFLINKDDQKALHYLLLSFKTIVNKINFKYKFEEKINLLDKKNCNDFVKRESTKKMLFEVKNLIEKYFIIDNIHNNFFSYIIRHSSISTVKDLSNNQKNFIMLLKKQFSEIDKYISYNENINSEFNRYYEGKYEQSCSYSFSNHILTIIKKLKDLAFKVSESIERPGFFITCMKPINNQVQNFLESDDCTLRKTEWLFYPEDHQDLLESIKKIPDLLRDQEKINSYCINIIKNDEIYAKLFDDQELSFILKISGYLSSKISLEKHLSFTISSLIDSPIHIREEKRKEILQLLNDNNIYLNGNIDFFDNYIKLVLKTLDETEYYRNSLFIRDNFLNIAINQG